MQRRPSPLLQDYKAIARGTVKKSQPLRWFVAGLGVPLLATSAYLLLGSDEPDPLPTAPTASLSSLAPSEEIETSIVSEEIETSVIEEAVFTPEPVAGVPEMAPDDEELPDFHPPLIFPDDDYDTLLLTVQRGDTLDRIFRKHDLKLADLAQIAGLDGAGKHLRMLKPGDEIEIRHRDGELLRLYRKLELTSALEIRRDDDGFSASIVDRPVETRKRMAYGRIKTSLFESGAAAGLSDKLIMSLAGIFAWDVDFVLDIRRDDNYYIVYEELWQDGELAGDGEIIAAEFNNDGRTHRAIRYIDDNGRRDYFTPEGRSVRKAFVRAPVDFTRISSNFNPRRRHPILNTIRAHRGVDYAAPRGTAVKAAGDGKIIFRGVKGGYGNAVILQHGGNITTLYAHLNSFDRQARLGSRVRQGQTIGYVGDSGLATAPHLHYEYRLNGVHRNPRTVELPQADPIRSEYMQDFLAKAAPVLAELDQFKETRVATASTD